MVAGFGTLQSTVVAIPLGQGQVFNWYHSSVLPYRKVAIPLGQGQVFNMDSYQIARLMPSQSLWVRDRFLIIQQREVDGIAWVAIPLG